MTAKHIGDVEFWFSGRSDGAVDEALRRLGGVQSIDYGRRDLWPEHINFGNLSGCRATNVEVTGRAKLHEQPDASALTKELADVKAALDVERAWGAHLTRERDDARGALESERANHCKTALDLGLAHVELSTWKKSHGEATDLICKQVHQIERLTKERDFARNFSESDRRACDELDRVLNSERNAHHTTRTELAETRAKLAKALTDKSDRQRERDDLSASMTEVSRLLTAERAKSAKLAHEVQCLKAEVAQAKPAPSGERVVKAPDGTNITVKPWCLSGVTMGWHVDWPGGNSRTSRDSPTDAEVLVDYGRWLGARDAAKAEKPEPKERIVVAPDGTRIEVRHSPTRRHEAECWRSCWMSKSCNTIVRVWSHDPSDVEVIADYEAWRKVAARTPAW